jgi:hypothetical protein
VYFDRKRAFLLDEHSLHLVIKKRLIIFLLACCGGKKTYMWEKSKLFLLLLAWLFARKLVLTPAGDYYQESLIRVRTGPDSICSVCVWQHLIK